MGLVNRRHERSLHVAVGRPASGRKGNAMKVQYSSKSKLKMELCAKCKILRVVDKRGLCAKCKESQ